ncbi:SCO4983 family protein [Streptomyces sp. NPDC002577]
MYEPIRTKSVHTMAGAPEGFPHRSREEELDIQLAGHLAALLAVTDDLRALSAEADLTDLDAAAEQLAREVARLRDGEPPVRAAVASAAGDGSPAAGTGRDPRLAALHQRAHALAGRALVVAASRADTGAAILAARRMDAHAAAQEGRQLAAC